MKKITFLMLMLGVLAILFHSNQLIAHIAAGNGNLTFNLPAPVLTNVTVCGTAQTFTLTVKNISGSAISGGVLTLNTGDSGVDYVASSVTGATENDITNLSIPKFNLPSIAGGGGTAIVTYNVTADCTSGSGAQPNYRVDYTGGFDDYTTGPSFVIQKASLSITAVTLNGATQSGNNYTGAVNETFTRCMTITNGGLGAVSSFKLEDVHGAAIDVLSADKGTFTNTSGAEYTTLSGTDFASVGDGDNLFEQNEEITVCMQVKILSCSSANANSTIKAFWGCGGSYTSSSNCQQNTVAAGVLFPNAQPNLQITHSYPNGLSTCVFDGLTNSRLTIRNKGTGVATAVKLALHKYYDMYFAESSFITLRDSATNAVIPIDSIKNLGAGFYNLYGFTGTTAPGVFDGSCYANSKFGYYLFLPNIPAGKTYYLDLKIGSCCPLDSDCDALFGGYNYNKIYSNACGIAFPETNNGTSFSSSVINADENYAPTTMSDEQVSTFNWLINTWSNSFPFGLTGSFDFEFTLGPCLDLNTAAVKIVRSNGNTINADSYTVTGNTVVAHFIPVPGATSTVNPTHVGTIASPLVSNAELFLNVKGDCQLPGCVGGTQTVDVKVRNVSRTDCVCKPVIGCVSANTVMLGCNTNPCPGGLDVSYFDFKRINYGQPDNETSPTGGNGVPDATGSIDTTKIRTDRAMYGDTLLTRYRGNIVTNAANPTWDSLFAVGSFANGGDMMQFLSATLTVVRGGTTYTCNNFTPIVTTSTGTALSLTRTFTYNLTSAAVSGCGTFPAGFVYQNGDHVKFDPKYTLTPLGLTSVNGDDFRKIQYNGRMYTVGADPTDIATPAGTSVGEFQCGIILGNIYVYDYAVLAYNGSGSVTITGCNTATMSSSIRGWLGPNTTTYDNLFPFEYRNYFHLKTVSWVLPAGYAYVNSTISIARTAGTFTASVDYSAAAIVPTILTTAAGLDSLVYNIEALYDFAGGNAKLPDEEMSITLNTNIVPSCDTPVGTTVAKEYLVTTFHGAMATPPTNANDNKLVQNDSYFNLVYAGRPVITLQPATATTTTYDNTVTWDIQVQNTTNNSTFNAKNLWFGECNTNGVTITKITDLGTSTDLTYNSTSQLYEAGTVAGNSTRNFRVYGTFSVCVPDTMYLCAGWNCPGYPTSVSDYSCTVLRSKLTVDPKEPDLQISVTPTDATTINLCGEQTYTITGLNVLQGNAYDIRTLVNLPTGLTIVPGSSKLRYPSPTGSYTTVSDPTDLGSNVFEWDISTLNSTVGTGGLKGVNSAAEQRQFDLQFQVESQCGFVSGSNGSVTLKGKKGCGASIADRTIPLPPLNLNGAVTPYNSVILLSAVSPLSCTNPNTLTINVKNNGPGVFGNADSVFVTLPTGISYGNTFTALLNAPASGSYKTRVVAGQTVLIWKLPNGLANGALSSFNIGLTGNPTTLTCGDLPIKVDTRLLQNLICEDDGSSCPSLISTGTATLTATNPAADLNALTDQTICFGKSFTAVTATGSNLECANIQWYNNNGSNNATTTAISGQTSLTLSSLPTAAGSYSYKVVATKGDCKDSSIINLVINPNPTAVASVTSGLTCTTTSIDISGTGSTTTTGTTYGWLASGGATKSNIIAGVTTHSPTVDAAGTYTLTVTGANGCTATASVTVTSNTTVPNANAGSTKTLTCTTTTIGLSGSSSTTGATYGWTASGGATSSNITAGGATLTPTVNSAGTYTLTVTGTNGCTATASVSVSNDSTLPNANAGSTKTLTCTTTTIGLSGSSSTTGATYGWAASNGAIASNITAGGATLTPTVNSAGTYTLTVTGTNGCTATASVSVSNDTTLPNANAGSTKTLTCTTTTIGLSGSSSTTGATYGWVATNGGNITAGGATLTPTVNSAGTYTLTVTGTNGCTATASVSVSSNTTLPNANAGSTKTLTCTTTTIGLSGSSSTTGATYGWVATNGGNITAGGATLTPTVNSAGTYTLTVTGTNGCTATASVSVSNDTTLPNANAGSTKTLTCTTTTIGLGGSSSTIGATYGWAATNGGNITAGGATLTPTVNSAGTYTLTVTGTNGCTATATVSVSLNTSRPDIGSLTNKTITCTNTQVILNGVSNTVGATFAWTGPNGYTSAQAQPIVSQQGVYTLTVTDPNNGCIATASVSVAVNNTLPDANAGLDKTITCNVQAVQINGNSNTTNVTYTWNGPGNYISSIQSPTVSNSGTYVLTVTALNGCTATDAVLVTNNTGMSNMTVSVNSPCLNNALLFNISGTQTGYTYVWSGPGGFNSTMQNPQIPNAIEANSGTYNVTITGTNGCKVVRTVTATVQQCCAAEAGNITIIDPTLCVGDKIKASTSIILPKLNYEFYFLLVENQTNVIIEKIQATNNNPITFNTTTPALYTVYGIMLKTGVGTAPTITLGTTTINDLLLGTNSNYSNYNTPNCYDLSGNNAQVSVPAPFSVLAQSGNIYEGNQGGISPFNYTIHEIYVLGGTPPYNYSWSNTNFVKPGIQEATDANHTLTLPDGTPVNGPGTNVEIIYADNATWHLTITDANGCSSTLLVFSNDAGANGQTDTIGGKILDIDNYQIKGAVLAQKNGAVRICVSGGEVGCVPTFQWSGPQNWTNNAPANAPGITTGTTAPGACGAGTTSYDLTGLPTGWYTVTVTCGSQTTEGWYWVPKKRPGRGGKDDIQNAYIDAYPNPFSSVTNIGFVSGVTGTTTVNLYSIDGKKMAELYKGETIENEAYTIQVEGNHLPNGTYFVTLQQGNGSVVTQKIWLQK